MVISKICEAAKLTSQAKFTSVIIILAVSIIIGSEIVSSAFADNPANINYSVTVEPALNITTSSNKVSLDLNPLNHDFDSQDLTVSVSTNNETGYKLYVNTDSTKLIEKDDSNLYIETLADEVPDDADSFTSNRWGYKLDSNGTKFSPFVSGTLINSSKTQIENNSSTLTFAAKVGYGTKAGTYALALNFQATANPHIPYMQDYDKVTCATEATGTSTPVMDKRDGNEYHVRYINGNCWMVQNLRFSGSSLTADTSNVTSVYTDRTPLVISWGDLTLGNSNDVARLHDSGNVNNGYWYNFAGASAMTIVGSSNVNATYDICPKNWHLPTLSESNGISTTYKTTFFDGGSMITGGAYNNGAPSNISYGYWWTSTSSYPTGGDARQIIRFDGSGSGYGNRYYGLYIRCIRSS